MRIRPILTAALLPAAFLPVALPAAVTAAVAMHVARDHHPKSHHHEAHHHEGHHQTGHDHHHHHHQMDAAAEPDRPATRPSPPDLPTVTAAAQPGLTLPDPATLAPVIAAPWATRRGPPPPLLQLHCSLLL
jgi:hypothetical protein